MAASSFSFSNQMFGSHFSSPSTPSPQRHVAFRHPIPRISSATCATASNSTAPETASLYELLGLRMGASCQEIKAAYRRLARTLHPDVASDAGEDEMSAAEQFMRVRNAYSTLSDPEKRAEYDQQLFRRRRQSAGGRAPASVCSFTGRSRSWETDQCW